MLLTHFEAIRLFRPSRVVRMRMPLAIIGLLAAAGYSCGGTPSSSDEPLPCVVEIPVYSATGERLPFSVAHVTPEGAEGPHYVDMLATAIDGIKVTAMGDKVLFWSRRIVGARAIKITLTGPKGAQTSTTVTVTQCRQRTSLTYGQSDLGFDVAGMYATGQLAGCAFSGDWWVRGLPMFGGGGSHAIRDALVRRDGHFVIALPSNGVRHLFIIGKGKQPVRVIAMNMTIGERNDLGRIELGGFCPDE